MKLRREFTQREVLLGMLILLLVVLVPLLRLVIIPAYRSWGTLRDHVQFQEREYLRLKRNLAMRGDIEREFGRLGAVVFQRESDQAVLSAWLRDLEAAARNPTVTLVNLRPFPIAPTPLFKSYGAKVTVTGSLPEIVRFVDGAASGDKQVKLESFSLRGIQGPNMVECTLSLQLICLLPSGDSKSPPVTGGGT